MPPRRPQQPPQAPQPDPNDPRNPGMYGGSVDPRVGGIRPMPGYTMPITPPGGIRPWPQGAPGTPFAGGSDAPLGQLSGLNPMGGTLVNAPGSSFNTGYGSRHNSGADAPGLNPSTAPAPAGLPPAAGQEYTRYQVAMQEVLNEEQDPAKRQYMSRVYQDFLNRYAAFARQSTAETNRLMNEQMRTRGVVDPLAMQHAAQNMNHSFIASFNSDLDQRYGPGGRDAWNKLAAKMSGPSVFESVGSNFYSSEDARRSGSTFGGIRFGGIAGGAIGALIGFSLFGGSGVMGWIAAGMMALGFAYGGNQLQKHFIDNRTPSPTPGVTPTLTADGRPAPQPQPGTPTLSMNADAPEVAAIPLAARASVEGTLPSGITASNVSDNYQPVVQTTPASSPLADARVRPTGPSPS